MRRRRKARRFTASFWALVVVLTIQTGMIVWQQIRLWQYESFMEAQIRIDGLIIEAMKSAEIFGDSESVEPEKGTHIR